MLNPSLKRQSEPRPSILLVQTSRSINGVRSQNPSLIMMMILAVLLSVFAASSNGFVVSPRVTGRATILFDSNKWDDLVDEDEVRCQTQTRGPISNPLLTRSVRVTAPVRVG